MDTQIKRMTPMRIHRSQNDTHINTKIDRSAPYLLLWSIAARLSGATDRGGSQEAEGGPR